MRGTDSYRAPEILDSNKYNSRSDIFALGCINYEIITGRPLFTSDWAVQRYAETGISIFPDQWPPCAPGSRLHDIGELTSSMLSADPALRPGAVTTLRKLQRIRHGTAEEAEEMNSSDDQWLDGFSPSPPPSSMVPQLQSGLRLPKQSEPSSLTGLNTTKISQTAEPFPIFPPEIWSPRLSICSPCFRKGLFKQAGS